MHSLKRIVLNPKTKVGADGMVKNLSGQSLGRQLPKGRPSRATSLYGGKVRLTSLWLAIVLLLVGISLPGCSDPNKAAQELIVKAENWIDNPNEQQQIEAIKYVQLRLSKDLVQKIQAREEYCLYAAADTCANVLKNYPKTAAAKRAEELMQRIDWRLSHNDVLKRFRPK